MGLIYSSVCLLLCIIATSNVITEWVQTCDYAHSWELYSAASLGNQADSTMAWYPTQSHYPDTELASPLPLLIMPSTLLGGSGKYQFDKSLVWLEHGFEPTISRMWDQWSTNSANAPGIIYSLECIQHWSNGLHNTTDDWYLDKLFVG